MESDLKVKQIGQKHAPRKLIPFFADENHCNQSAETLLMVLRQMGGVILVNSAHLFTKKQNANRTEFTGWFQ